MVRIHRASVKFWLSIILDILFWLSTSIQDAEFRASMKFWLVREYGNEVLDKYEYSSRTGKSLEYPLLTNVS